MHCKEFKSAKYFNIHSLTHFLITSQDKHAKGDYTGWKLILKLHSFIIGFTIFKIIMFIYFQWDDDNAYGKTFLERVLVGIYFFNIFYTLFVVYVYLDIGVKDLERKVFCL